MAQHDQSATTDTTDSDDDPVPVVMVSGFLGAGKTTALQTVGAKLTEQGYTVGMITNDQASGLVDTSILDRTAGTVVEIPGGCFCCNFGKLLRAAHSIDEQGVDILLAEPVGSCTDLVATVINPLRELHDDEFAVAPLTAVLDPGRVQSYLTDDAATLPEEVRYIFRLQVEEADVIALNKADTLTHDETTRMVEELETRVGDRPVIPVSAAQQDGMDRWMSVVLDGIETGDWFETVGQVTATGRALTDIDYDTYAEGEAKLGWVNMSVSLDGPVDTASFQTELMDRLQQALRTDDIEVAHLKFSIAADDTLSHANLTATDSEPSYSGSDPGTVAEANLVLNARAVGAPADIRTIASDAITATATSTGVDMTIEEEQAFRPEYPEPTHRIDGDTTPQ
jgi:G3E family GTPase